MRLIRLTLLATLAVLSLLPSKRSNAGIIVHGDDAVIRRCVLYTTHLQVAGTGDSLVNITSSDVILEADETTTAVNCILDSINVATGKTLTGVTNLVRSAAKGGAGTYTDTGTIFSGDVSLVDADNGDYGVIESSPAINAATFIGLTEDYDQLAWITYDIGAFRSTWPLTEPSIEITVKSITPTLIIPIIILPQRVQ